VDSRQAIPPMGSSSRVMPHISQQELEYRRMEEELRRMTAELARMIESGGLQCTNASGVEKDYLVAYNAQMQAVVSVRNNIIKHLNRIYLLVS
jgi:hypothetical protein